jgi:hypothetical protein
MNKLAPVNAPSNSIVHGISNPEDNDPSLNSWSLDAIEQVLLHFPGHDVFIGKGGQHQFHIHALPSRDDRSYGPDYGWMCRFYSAKPAICEGDDLGTTGACVAAVLMAATLTGIRLPQRLAEMTRLPFEFVKAVLGQTNAFDLWASRSLVDLDQCLRDDREDFATIEAVMGAVVEEYWSAFYSPEKVAALMTLRERRLFGGKVQHWSDAEAMDVFDL